MSLVRDYWGGTVSSFEANTKCCLAIFAFFYMQDYPGTARFLSAIEKIEIVRRLEQDRSSLADEFDMKYFFHAIKDWKIWVHMFSTIGCVDLTPATEINAYIHVLESSPHYTACHSSYPPSSRPWDIPMSMRSSCQFHLTSPQSFAASMVVTLPIS